MPTQYANANQNLLGRYFWRSYNGAEVDYIERLPAGGLRAYEFKYNSDKLSRGADSFSSEYGHPVNLISLGNYLEFITGSLNTLSAPIAA